MWSASTSKSAKSIEGGKLLLTTNFAMFTPFLQSQTILQLACNGIGTDCDHIKPGDDNSLDNLQWLSNACHKAKNSKRDSGTQFMVP